MKKIEEVLNWHESDTGIKFRQIVYNEKVIRCLIKSENYNTYRVIIDVYNKKGESLETSANSFGTNLDSEVIFSNIKAVYEKLCCDKPTYEYFMAHSL